MLYIGDINSLSPAIHDETLKLFINMLYKVFCEVDCGP